MTAIFRTEQIEIADVDDATAGDKVTNSDRDVWLAPATGEHRPRPLSEEQCEELAALYRAE